MSNDTEVTPNEVPALSDLLGPVTVVDDRPLYEGKSYKIDALFVPGTKLYTQAALDAAVAAERERCAKLREALQASQSWLYGHENTWGQVERRRLNDEALRA